jgi:GNAT superfamily N-acetyltransferase
VAAIEVKPVRSRGDLKRFIKLPWRIYRNAENWVPPLLMERKRHLDREKNPFFEHAEAEYFLAWRGGEPVGRITAHVDHRFNEFQDNDWGMFGFFECVEDQEVGSALLSTAEEWLRERGRDRMIGPMDFSTNHECGLLVDGFEVKPQVLESWHHPYYQEILEYCGLEKAMDLYKWSLHMSARESRLLPVLEDLAGKLEPEHGITVRNMRRRDFQGEVERFMEVYNQAWERNWGFVPLTENELRAYAKDLKPILDENWAFIAEKDGRTVGAALTILDYNEILAKVNGRLLPFGWVRFLRAKQTIKEVRVWALGVLPEYQHTGVAAKFYIEHFEAAARRPQKGGETGWILEANTAMNRAMEAMGGDIVKTFRIYEKRLAPRSSMSAS